MRRVLKIGLAVLVVLAAAWGIWFGSVVWSLRDLDFGSPVSRDFIVHFQDPPECVYMRSWCWGLLGDHEQIILSTLPIRDTEDTAARGERYVMWGGELYYEKKEPDTLVLHVWHREKIPELLSNGIHIVQAELQGRNYEDYRKNYREYGWSRVTHYPDDDTAEAAAVDTSCVNADSIQIVQAGPHDRTLFTIVIRKAAVMRAFPDRIGFADFVVNCQWYDTLVSILADFGRERSLKDTLEFGSFDFVATRNAKTVAQYMTGKEDSKRLLDRLIEAVKQMDKDNPLLSFLLDDRGEIDK